MEETILFFFFIIMFCQKYLPNVLLLGLYNPGLFNIIGILTRTLRSRETCDATGVLLVRDGGTRVGTRGKWPVVSSRADWAQFNFTHYHDRPISMYLTWDMGLYLENSILYTVFADSGQNLIIFHAFPEFVLLFV